MMHPTLGIRRQIALAAAFIAFTLPLAAQTPGEGFPDQEPVNPPRRGFSLFGLGEFAITGMRSSGRTSWFTTASTPGDTYVIGAWDLPGRVIGTASSPNAYCCGFFELQLWMASSRSDWLRHREIAPSLENVEGGGWNGRGNLQRWASPQYWDFQGKDGTIGTIMSGVTSESGTGTCRDNNIRPNSFVDPGYTLLPASDCPDTWAGGVFNPVRPIADTTWLRRFQSNPSGFTWDDWKVPANERIQDKLYGSFQTYGVSVDYGREALQRLGNTVPRGTGKPLLEGYAMGMEWNFQAWTYAVPTVADAMFYKVWVVNKSAEVYGVGLDYDSLYLGFMSRPFHTTSTQQPALYAVPQKGAMYENQTNTNNTNCYGAAHGSNITGGYTAGTNIRSCLSNTHANRGFRGGAGGLVFLKSPIGDLRNKKFTDPTSPFYNPSHPNRGDTLTFNHANGCGFTCAQQQYIPHRTRAMFGGWAHIETDALAGRGKTAGELTQLEYFDLFHTPDWPNRWSPGNPTVGGFAKYAPPGWDYNKDGVNDTLAVLTCHRTGCQAPWTDTLPGGFPNAFHNAHHTGVGPIKLRAGDTTSFIVAFLSTPDSTSFETLVDNVINVYQTFWLVPEPPCPVRISSTTNIGGNRQYDTEIRLFFDNASNECEDKFLIEKAKTLRASTAAADINLRVRNPSLVNDIRARALPTGTTLVDTVPLRASANALCGNGLYNAANCRIVTTPSLGVHDSLYVFKSCDNGVTFTASTGTACIPSPARDVGGNAPGYPWQAYATLGRDAGGKYPRTFRDGSVTGGLQYTYVVVGKSRSADFTVVDSGAAGLFTRTYALRPATLNALSTNTANPNVAVIYLPASAPGGGVAAAFRFAVTAPGDTSAAYSFTGRLAKPLYGVNSISGSLAVGDSAEVVVYDADTTLAGVTTTTVRLFATADTNPTGTAVVRVPVAQQTFTSTDPNAPPVVDRRLASTAGYVLKDSTRAGTREKWTFYRYRGNLPKVVFLQDGKPIFITDSLNSTDITPADAFERSDFSGLLVGFNPTGTQRTLRSTVWFAPGLGQLLASGAPTLGWTGNTARNDAAFSRYTVTWAGKEFGPGSPFRLNRLDPAATQADLNASLAVRAVAGNTSVTAATAALIATATGRSITVDSLAALTLPFTIQNITRAAPVTIAVLKNDRPGMTATQRVPTMLFGSGQDTLRLTIPDAHWVPGDRLYFIESVTQAQQTRVGTRTVTAVSGSTVHTTTTGQVDTVFTPVTQPNVMAVTWGTATLGCANTTCNPVEGPGGTGFTSTNPNQELRVLYYTPVTCGVATTTHPCAVTSIQTVNFTIDPARAAPSTVAYRKSELQLVRAVPNPYVMFSHYEQTDGTRRLMFTHLPPVGGIEIYTVAGQFVQRLTWTEGDLIKNCRATADGGECQPSGDLLWNMRTKEDLLVGPGLYLFRVSAKMGGKQVSRIGKFVIIPSADR